MSAAAGQGGWFLWVLLWWLLWPIASSWHHPTREPVASALFFPSEHQLQLQAFHGQESHFSLHGESMYLPWAGELWKQNTDHPVTDVMLKLYRRRIIITTANFWSICFNPVNREAYETKSAWYTVRICLKCFWSITSDGNFLVVEQFVHFGKVAVDNVNCAST